MAEQKIPTITSAGHADVPGRLAALDASQRFAVLATVGGGSPYTSLVAFALTPDGAGIVFATPRAASKYKNLRVNPEVSFLIDNRANTAGDIMGAEAVTVMGKARTARRGKKRDGLAVLLKAKHPELSGFIDADSTALVLVEITKALHVGRFQAVSVWEPER